jgi:ergothioneine biosynthesis protein EgtB
MTVGLSLWDDRSPPVHDLASRLFATRQHSLDLAAPLSAEDQVVQANDDASPTKWHLAHVTWFFETFLLKPYLPGYELHDERFPFCFNSYYEAEGARHPRGMRGLLTRPSHDEVMAYRAHVDQSLHALVASDAMENPDVSALLEVGIHHEQQHQELLLTDILSLFAAQPLRPAYDERTSLRRTSAKATMSFIDFEGGIQDIGHAGEGFSFDNEGPRHKALLQPYRLADRLVTNGEWLHFMEAGGYRDASIWLADGWGVVKTEGWTAPLYWERRDDAWMQMGLHGLLPVDPDAPVCNISFYEADAYARWTGHRLPTEFEWERAALELADLGCREGPRAHHPAAAVGDDRQMFGQVWQWTQSAYLPYPGYKPAPGAIGEYNGKFMCGQQVLRGSSCATSPGHERPTYRNFFYPHQRWQFTGLRLASDR